jgi:hypothetical protein
MSSTQQTESSGSSSTEEDATTTMSATTGVIVFLFYLAFNITGTIYYTKLAKAARPSVSKSLLDWNLASVILGWLLLPPLNLSAPITYATSK